MSNWTRELRKNSTVKEKDYARVIGMTNNAFEIYAQNGEERLAMRLMEINIRYRICKIIVDHCE